MEIRQSVGKCLAKVLKIRHMSDIIKEKAQ